MEITGKLSEFIKVLADIAVCSEDFFWISDSSFKHSLFISDGYERMLGRKSDRLYVDLKILNEYILPVDIMHRHPFIEMIKDLKENGPEARHHEKIHLFKADGQLLYVEDCSQLVVDQSGQCLAVTGIVKNITCIDLQNRLSVPKLTIFPNLKKLRYYLKGKYRNVYLTTREAECAFYFLQAKTQKEIAKKMNLSPRTVEHILERIKYKFTLHYKTDLYQALLESGLLDVLL